MTTSSGADSGGKDAAQSAQPSRQSQADDGQSAEREPEKELRDKPSSTVQDAPLANPNGGNADAGVNRPAPKQEQTAKTIVLKMSEPTAAEIAAVQAEYATGGIDGAK